MSFFSKLESLVVEKDSLLCVGLDPHGVDLGDKPTAAGAKAFCLKIIEATSKVAVAYKPNIAFFEALGVEGMACLEEVLASIPSEIPVLLDAKRGDISSTADAYATAAFDKLNVGAITIHPYMGSDSVNPFTKYSDRGVFVLCKTSNPSSNEFETLPLLKGKQLYEEVALKCEEWNNATKNVGVVVGATDTEALSKTRIAAPGVWILAPGIGAQGGNLQEAVAAGIRKSDNSGLLVPVSRGISRAPDMTKAAEELRSQINDVRKSVGSKKQKVAADGIKEYQKVFFETAISCGVLKFGTFTLKSGRESPYFFNAGHFDSGMALFKLANCYANAIHESGIEYDVIFGPAYKGIPLAAVISSAMFTLFGRDVKVTYNRKEKKDHGEGGTLVGASLKGKRALIVDDTITAGTAIRESISMIKNAEGTIAGVIVALDRQEKISEDSSLSAAQGVEKEYGFPVVSIAGLTHLMGYLEGDVVDAETVGKVKEYRERYGVDAN